MLKVVHRGEVARALEAIELLVDLAEQRRTPAEPIDRQLGRRRERGQPRLAKRGDRVVERLILVELAGNFGSQSANSGSY